MKQLLKNIAPVFLLVFLASCLKDNGFENQDYGMNDLGTDKHVSFLKSYEKDGNNVVGILATPVIEDFDFFVLNISGQATKSDVTVNIVIDNTIITESNTANGTAFLTLPAAAYELPLSYTYPAGADFLRVKLKLKKGAIDVTKTYALGVKIGSTSDGSIKLTTNQNKRLISFLIKNKYDGVYRLRGFHNRPGLDAPYNEEVHMVTTGAASVSMFWPALGGYAHPLNGGVTYYGTFTTNFIFNASDQLIAWDWTPYATTLPVAVGPALDSRYDPATKTIYAQFFYNNNPGARRFTDTLFYIGPRP